MHHPHDPHHPGPFRTLSKSDFKVARTCPTKLYYRELGYPTNQDDDEYLAMLAQGGYMIEMIAKLRYPTGIPLEHGADPVADARATQAFLRHPRVTLFEPTFLSGRKLARVDILERDGDDFRIVEVKAKSFDTAQNAARLLSGKPSLFRHLKNPRAIVSEWEEYIADLAFQVLVLRELYPYATIRPFLCLVDKQARTTIDGLPSMFRIERRPDAPTNIHRVHFTGDPDEIRADNLLVEIDVAEEVALLMDEVRDQAELFEASLRGELTRLAAPLGAHCGACEYRLAAPTERHGFAECWGEHAEVRPIVLDLYRPTRTVVEATLRTGRASLFDIPETVLTRADGTLGPTAERQLVQIRHTRHARPWVSERLHAVLEGVTYPLHFIDFEATRPAVPPHAGMRPYGLVAFQWSCHTVDAPGATPRHRDWLNTRDLWPNAEFARTLRAEVGTKGTVLAWANFERNALQDVLRELEPFGHSDRGLEEWLTGITEPGRIVDLNRVTLQHFFHPDMGGSTSIKVVLDALWRSDPVMRARFREIMGYDGDPATGPYAALPPIEINGVSQRVAEGTGAIRAYEAMMYGVERDDPVTTAAWQQLLRQYCQLDTLAMVLIWEHWGRTA